MALLSKAETVPRTEQGLMKHFWGVTNESTRERMSKRMCEQALGCASACADLSAWIGFLSASSQAPPPHPLVPLALNGPPWYL